jgi:general secretion pathway protein L
MSLSDAAAAVKGRRFKVLLPGRDILLAQVDIPSRRRSEVTRALPYALEEWLVEAPEMQHYVWCRTASGVAAAVVARTRLEAWLERLSDAGMEPDVLLPETLALPWRQGEWSLALAGGEAWLRTGASAGYACDRDVLPTLFDSLWTSTEATQWPERLHVWLVDGELPDGLPLPVVTEANSEAITAVFHAPDETLNLLSGPYAPRRALATRFGPWRIAAAAAGIWLLSVFGLHVAQYYKFSHEADALQARIDAVFHAAVPNVKRVVDAKVQMQQALDALSNNGQAQGGALVLLADSAEVFARQKGLKIIDLTYRKGHLALQMTGPDFSAFERFKTQLQRRGLSADLSAVSNQNGVSRGRLEVWRGGGA